MRYIKVDWIHSHPKEPVSLFSELDEEGWELRKVEVFRDGSFGFASKTESAMSTRLGIEPLPSLEEIAKQPEFRPCVISKQAFEKVWSSTRS